MPQLDLKKLPSFIPYLGAFLVFLGILKLTVYYSAFNVPINSFLDPTEFLTAFLSFSLFYIGLFVLLAVAVFSTSEESQSVQKRNEALLNEPKLFNRITIFVRASLVYFVLLNAAVAIPMLVSYLRATTYWLLLLWINGSFLLMFVLAEFKRRYFTTHGEKLDPSYSNLLLLVASVIFLVFLTSRADVYKVKEEKKYSTTSFKVDNLLIQSDSSNYYIGHTRNFLFFFHEDSDRTQIFPMSRVSELTLTPLNKGRATAPNTPHHDAPTVDKN